MRWQDIKSEDERDLYFWERKNEANLMASSPFLTPENKQKWLDEAKRYENLEHRNKFRK